MKNLDWKISLKGSKGGGNREGVLMCYVPCTICQVLRIKNETMQNIVPQNKPFLYKVRDIFSAIGKILLFGKKIEFKFH